ncbi:quinolinate synthase NadA [Thalassoglobus polymorphus]|uniref:Quinolinate synthase n=1 Tax=Thalassoglobus polymorphus TaxID=2527994 RepID=A0A517QPZ6_9PLAN|nr:quinolinate synthase NadA [Thalassoglobus polymorphus]QDT33653.1 Quinolinate synthase A [Thalassoglobus polymorphus]
MRENNLLPIAGEETGIYEDPLDLMDEIDRLKVAKDATILAHYYVDGEIQDIADFAGDSLQLARDAVNVTTSTIVFAGVHFMAETAKMLNPEKTVLLPDLQAGCSLSESCPADKLAAYQAELRAKGHDIVTVAYINTSAAVKSLCDWIVTSGNAREVVENRVPKDKEILFVPDQHLGRYLMEVTGREMILWPGSCMVHEVFSLQDLIRAKKNNPDSLVISHPECPQNILDVSDFVGGTEKMRQHVAAIQEPKTFLVATEANMIHPLEAIAPQHEFIPVPGIMTDTGETCACNRCPHMARNTLQKVRDCLKRGKPEILWQPYFDKAKEVVSRSLLQ